MTVRIIMVLAATLLGGCPLAHDSSLPYRCTKDEDCFQHQGEYCQKPPGSGMDDPGECRIQPLEASVPDRAISVPDTGISVPDTAISVPDTAVPPADAGDAAPGDLSREAQ